MMAIMLSAGHDGWPTPVADVLIAGALIALALVYLRGWYHLRAVLPQVFTGARLAAFWGGVFALWVAVGSPLATLDHQLLTFHMLQHLVLMTVAAPLLLLGAQAGILLQRVSQRSGGGFPGRLLGLAAAQRLGQLVNHPVFCWLAATATVIGWHVPALFELGMHSEKWHDIEQACFFTAGLLFWWPVVQSGPGQASRPQWSVPLYLFLATLPCDALSAFLTFCNRVVYSHYGPAHYNSPQHLFDISPLADQEYAGALMWVWVTFAYLAPAGAITVQMLSPKLARQARIV